MPDEILTAAEVWKTYGGVKALRGAGFGLRAGEVHALMGENGAGKSTLSKVMAGVVTPDRGEISLNGAPVTIPNPLSAQRLGISIIHQELDLFPNLTVAENLAIANEKFVEHGLVRFGDLDRFAGEYLKQVGLSVAPARRLSSLSIGEMQLVAIARALSMQARIILMDEPTSSLFHDSVERLFQLVAKLKGQGVAIVYVSHKMDEIFRICDRVTVMRDGETVGTRHMKEVSSSDLISMMVGRKWEGRMRKAGSSPGDVLLSVSSLVTGKLRDVTFQVRRGEVLGVAGLVGAGRSELGAALVGLDAWKTGAMTLRGAPVKPASVSAASALGMRLLAEDRKLEGLMMQMTILENSTIADLPRFATRGVIRRGAEQRAVAPVFRRLAVKASSLAVHVSTLSGGNQQKVLLARCLLADPDLLFLDDPTRGVDIGAKEDIYGIIEELAASGKAVIFVSSELPELLRCCDRILVMREGRITASLRAAETSQEEIMSFATNPVAAEDAGWRN